MQVNWLRPVAGGPDGIDVHVSLLPQDDGQILFEIHGDDDGRMMPWCTVQGMLRICDSPRIRPSMTWPRCASNATCHASGAQACYALRAHGTALRNRVPWLQELFVGADQVLRTHRPARCHASAKDDYGLHPSLLDAACRPSVWAGQCGGRYAPVAACCPGMRWRYARPVRRRHVGAGAASCAEDGSSLQFDIDLLR
jgi:hypothetical protein